LGEFLDGGGAPALFVASIRVDRIHSEALGDLRQAQTCSLACPPKEKSREGRLVLCAHLEMLPCARKYIELESRAVGQSFNRISDHFKSFLLGPTLADYAKERHFHSPISSHSEYASSESHLLTSLGLAQNGLGSVFVDFNTPWENEFALTSCPHVMPTAVPGEVPAKIAERLLKVPKFHKVSLHVFV
jgi:hypothetical protein